MKRIVRLTESDLTRIVRRIIMEGNLIPGQTLKLKEVLGELTITIIKSISPTEYEGIIQSHKYDFGGYQTKMSNIAVGNLVRIKMTNKDNYVNVILPDTYKNPVYARIVK